MAWWRRRREQSGRRSAPPPRVGTSFDFEKPEVKTLTQPAANQVGGLGFDETAGLAGAAGILEAAAAGEVRDRSLRAPGQSCSRCEKAFTEDTPVRRTVAGEWVHDVCP